MDVVALRGGRGLYDYTSSPTSPVSQRPKKQWDDVFSRVSDGPYNFCPDWDLTRFRYFLANTPSPGVAEAVAYALRTEASFVAHEGTWYLFESRLPVVPVDAEEEPTPYPAPPTLRRKLKDAAKELEASPDTIVSDIDGMAALKLR
jgi:hypothetical protein